MTKTSPAAQGTVAGAPLTEDELKAIYAGPHVDAAIGLVFGSHAGTTIGEIRDKLRAMLSASPSPEALPASGVEAVKLRRDLGGVRCQAFGGDNLAIFIVSEFEGWADEDEEQADDSCWKPSALAKTDQVLDAIHAHYAPALTAGPSALSGLSDQALLTAIRAAIEYWVGEYPNPGGFTIKPEKFRAALTSAPAPEDRT